MFSRHRQDCVDSVHLSVYPCGQVSCAMGRNLDARDNIVHWFGGGPLVTVSRQVT